MSSLGFFYRNFLRSHLGGYGGGRWSGAPAAILPILPPTPPPCWESLLEMEKENEQVLNSSLVSVAPDGPEVTGIFELPNYMNKNIAQSLSKKNMS